MRTFLSAAIMLTTMTALPVLAQTAPLVPTPYASAADVAAAEAKVKASPTNAPQVLVAAPPFRALLEFRPKPTPASLHERQDELITVIDGSGTFIVGGTLKDEKRRNESNLTGSGIEGGTTYALTKGAYVFVPAGTAHYFAGVGAEGLTISTVYVPHGGVAGGTEAAAPQ